MTRCTSSTRIGVSPMNCMRRVHRVLRELADGPLRLAGRARRVDDDRRVVLRAFLDVHAACPGGAGSLPRTRRSRGPRRRRRRSRGRRGRGRLFFACSTTCQRSASKTMAFAPQCCARYTSSAAVDRHDTLTAAAPKRAGPALHLEELGPVAHHEDDARAALRSRARWSPPPTRFIRSSSCAYVRRRSRQRMAGLSGEFAA